MATKSTKSPKKKQKTSNYNYANDNKKELDILLKDLHFKPKNEHQGQFCKMIDDKEIIICSGPAGVGKSMLSVAKALELLKNPNNNYSKIILCTPAVEADEQLGFLPGSVDEKLAPYTFSTLYLLKKLVGEEVAKILMSHKYVEIMALAFMRGINIDNSIVIAEEFQNATPRQVKTLLTRIGYDSKFIISGDLEQSDKYKKSEQSGLYDAMNKFEDVNEIGVFKFDEKDIVRNKIISIVLDKYK